MKRRIFSLFLAVLMVMSVCVVSGGVLTVSNGEALAAADDNAQTKDDVGGKWIGAWGCGMTHISLPDYPDIYPSFKNAAARIVLTPTASGNRLRLRLSNIYGDTPLVISAIRVHKSTGKNGPEVKVGTGKIVTYSSGSSLSDALPTTIVIPAHKEIVTDPVDFDVVAGEDIVVTLYISDELQNITSVALSGAKTYIAAFQKVPEAIEDLLLPSGNFVNIPLSSKIVSGIIPALQSLPDIDVVPCLSGVDVFNTEEDPYSIVVIGDSTVTNQFPALLANEIENEGYTSVGVVGKGIIGNSLLVDGEGKLGKIYGEALLDRMNVDLLKQAGVRYAVIKIGANDITHPVSQSIADYGEYTQPTAQDIINGYKEFITKCHNYDIKVIGCTITQWKDATRNYFGTTDGEPEYEWTEEDWQIALDVNKWMLSNVNSRTGFDAVYDLAELSASPTDSAKFRSGYSLDNIHPSEKAQRVWAQSFPLYAVGIETVPAHISIYPTTLTLSVGKSYDDFDIRITPESAAYTDITWKSSNSSVAYVSSDGIVTAKKNGTATITCTTINGLTAKCKVTVKTTPTSVTLNKKELTLYTTQTEKLKATVNPSAAEDKSVKWVSSDESVAKVSSKGTVTAVGKGTATIKCITTVGAKSASCKVTVKKGVRVEGLKLNKTSKTVYKGQTYQLTPTFTPENATNKKITWESSDTDVALVDSNGKVTGVKNGKATIWATTQDGDHTAVCKVTVKTKATGVKLNKKSVTVYVDKDYTLTATVSPSSASNKNVKWKSSDKSVATVNSKGVVTGKKTGTATITCTTEDGSYKATCTVKVEKYHSVKSVKLNKSSVKIEGGESYTLKATVNPSNASNKSVKWTSSNSKIAKVSSSGKVTGLKKGTVTITCTTSSGKKTATCTVKVTTTPVTKVSLNKKSLVLDVSEKYTLKATVSPSDATDKDVKWTSDDKSVATVSSSGKVTAKGVGTCTITCITYDGNLKAKCKVVVTDPDEAFDIGNGDSGSGFVTVKLNKGSLSLKNGEKYTLKYVIDPANTAVKSVTWTSKNTSVAKVSSSGVVTAVGAAGTSCDIVCNIKTASGTYETSCKVYVVK